MLEENEWATIRQLPDGDSQPIRIEGLEERRLRVTVPPGTEDRFIVGSLVEVQSTRFVYLGTVLGWQDFVMLLAIEHALDRAAIEAIRNIWHVPSGA